MPQPESALPAEPECARCHQRWSGHIVTFARGPAGVFQVTTIHRPTTRGRGEVARTHVEQYERAADAYDRVFFLAQAFNSVPAIADEPLRDRYHAERPPSYRCPDIGSGDLRRHLLALRDPNWDPSLPNHQTWMPGSVPWQIRPGAAWPRLREELYTDPGLGQQQQQQPSAEAALDPGSFGSMLGDLQFRIADSFAINPADIRPGRVGGVDLGLPSAERTVLSLYGIPIVVEPSLPPDQAYLLSRTGSQLTHFGAHPPGETAPLTLETLREAMRVLAQTQGAPEPTRLVVHPQMATTLQRELERQAGTPVEPGPPARRARGGPHNSGPSDDPLENS